MQEASTAISSTDLESQIDLAFEMWMDARCQSISNNFAPTAVETLTNLKSQLAPNGELVYVGAITDGNSNPTAVPELEGVFDFVIRAEEVGASKPDKRVYRAAVAALMAKLANDGKNVEHFFLGNGHTQEQGMEATAHDMYMTISGSTSWKDVEVEAVEAFSDAVGPWWVHIGDDFFKDVVAAKDFRMRTVWARELIGGAGAAVTTEQKSKAEQRSVTDLMKDVTKSNDGILKMSIGESEFLSQSLHEEFSDVILDRFEDLGSTLLQWHEEGRVLASRNGGPKIENEPATSLPKTEVVEKVNQQGKEDRSETGSGSQMSKKFCVFCGEKIPAAAKFCSHCGERQE